MDACSQRQCYSSSASAEEGRRLFGDKPDQNRKWQNGGVAAGCGADLGCLHPFDVLTSHWAGLHPYRTGISCKHWNEKGGQSCGSGVRPASFLTANRASSSARQAENAPARRRVGSRFRCLAQPQRQWAGWLACGNPYGDPTRLCWLMLVSSGQVPGLGLPQVKTSLTQVEGIDPGLGAPASPRGLPTRRSTHFSPFGVPRFRALSWG